jgi:hypothetical protein
MNSEAKIIPQWMREERHKEIPWASQGELLLNGATVYVRG